MTMRTCTVTKGQLSYKIKQQGQAYIKCIQISFWVQKSGEYINVYVYSYVHVSLLLLNSILNPPLRVSNKVPNIHQFPSAFPPSIERPALQVGMRTVLHCSLEFLVELREPLDEWNCCMENAHVQLPSFTLCHITASSFTQAIFDILALHIFNCNLQHNYKYIPPTILPTQARVGIYSHNLSPQGYKGNYGYKFVPSRCIASLYSKYAQPYILNTIPLGTHTTELYRHCLHRHRKLTRTN